MAGGGGKTAQLTAGALLIVVGIALTFLGIFFIIPACIGIPMVIIGVILLIVEGGKVTHEQPPVVVVPGGYPLPTSGAPGAAPGVAVCPVCGQPLAWIPAYNRWYCSRCGQYR